VRANIVTVILFIVMVDVVSASDLACEQRIADEVVDSISDGDVYVGIGMRVTNYKQFMINPFPLEKMPISGFDIYGANEDFAMLKAVNDWLDIL